MIFSRFFRIVPESVKFNFWVIIFFARKTVAVATVVLVSNTFVGMLTLFVTFAFIFVEKFANKHFVCKFRHFESTSSTRVANNSLCILGPNFPNLV